MSKFRASDISVRSDLSGRNCYVTFKVAVTNSSINELDKIKDLQDMDIEIKKHREHRSRNANDYMWVLLDKMSDALHNTKDKFTLYREYVLKFGVFTPLPIPNDEVEAWCKNWESGGTGWIGLIIGDSKLKGYTMVHAYFGSSTYNTKQMSRLIEAIVLDAQEMGIDTMTPNELERLCGMQGSDK